MSGVGKTGDFSELVAFGENPNGVRTEGAFGVSHGGIGPDYYRQWDFGKNIAGSRWGGPSPELTVGVDIGGSALTGKKLKGGR